MDKVKPRDAVLLLLKKTTYRMFYERCHQCDGKIRLQ